MKILKKALFIFAWLCIMSGPAHAASLTIGCAANFTAAMKELVTLYHDETGITAECSFGSTGMLYGQITKGAPFDLFLAADEKRPDKLFAEGLALKPALYAKGKIVLWSKRKELAKIKDWIAVVCASDIKRVGIANPKTAPYGQRATEAMAATKVYSKVEPKLAFGKSVGVAFQYAYSGAADASFVALSQALSAKGATGAYWPVPQAGLVNQAACIIKDKNTEAAAAFLTWMTTPQAKAIITKYGYE